MTKSAQLRKYLDRAIKEKFAIPAINTTNMETTQSIVEAAKELKAPVILQITESAIKYAGFEYIESILKIADSHPNVFVHLDHGTTLEMAKRCIESPAFSSVMIDKSKTAFEENVNATKEIKEYAGYKLVEAELGIVGGKEEDIVAHGSIYTQPEEAKQFIDNTKVDILAIAIGTAHGVYKDEPKLNYEIIGEIRALVGDIPLVLHGSSGLSDEQLRKSVEAGINKVNLDTEIKQAYISGFMNYLGENPADYDLRKIFGNARLTAKEAIKDKIRVLGAENKAEGTL